MTVPNFTILRSRFLRLPDLDSLFSILGFQFYGSLLSVLDFDIFHSQFSILNFQFLVFTILYFLFSILV